jgi:hypothetical protein
VRFDPVDIEAWLARARVRDQRARP